MCLNYTDIIIIRHGQTAWNEEGRVQGQGIVGLNPKGLNEAEELGHYLATGRRCTAIYSSDLPRSLETANKISLALGLPISSDHRLREISAGSWEGKIFNSISSKDRTALAADPYEYRFPGGETWKEVQARTLTVITEIASTHIGERVIVVTHGGPIRAALTAWGNAGIDNLPVLNGSITQMQWYESENKPVIISIGVIPFSSSSRDEFSK
jgi:broad specificity phosphatase PhoE